jgi:ribosomal protein S18 acetylase RimI-like enzyme
MMGNCMSKPDFVIRSFAAGDSSACRRLYTDGLIRGKNADNDTGLDIDDIHAAYIKPPGNHFWVADYHNAGVVGMIGVMLSEGTGEIRRLRVREDFRRRGIGSALLEQAVAFCKEQNYLKVAIDTLVDTQAAIKMLEKFHFLHGKTRNYAGKDLMYFYLDLYSSERQDGDA